MKYDPEACMVRLDVTRSKSYNLILQRVSPTPGECYMVTQYQVLNVHLAKVLDYNTMQVYIVRFVTF